MKARLIGSFSIVDAQGVDRAPRGAKPRAALALILAVPEHRRSRRWLESKLWSDRFMEQASGSLRQALIQIGKAFGPDKDCLHADREDVWLTGVTVDTTADQAALAEGREFLEGLDVPDPAFQEWLALERVRISPERPFQPLRQDGRRTPTAPSPNLKLVLDPVSGSNRGGAFLGRALAQAIGAVVSEFADTEIYDLLAHEGLSASEIIAPGQGFVINVASNATAEAVHCLVTVAEPMSGKVLWSRSARLPPVLDQALSDIGFGEIVFHTADAAHQASIKLAASARDATWVSSMTASAVRSIFTFDADRLHQADTLLGRVIDIQPSARAYAWRGHLRQIMAVERIDGDWDTMRDEADEFACRALEMSSSNPLVLALVSQIRTMLDDDGAVGYQLAREALNASPNNGFALAAMSGASLRLGRYIDALQYAENGAKLGANTVFSGWWHALAGLSAMALGRIEESLTHYQIAHVRAVKFRSPMRHLYFMYLANGEHDKAARVLRNLKRVEPDFSVNLVRDDPSYPISTLRKTPLLRAALTAM